MKRSSLVAGVLTKALFHHRRIEKKIISFDEAEKSGRSRLPVPPPPRHCGQEDRDAPERTGLRMDRPAT
jgi:hypothetical protein